MPKHIVERLERIDYLIRTKSTGTPKQLAAKLTLSERCVRNYISVMKELGAPITYSRKRGCYCYEEPGRFNFYFSKSDWFPEEVQSNSG